MSRSFFLEERTEEFMNVPTYRAAYKPRANQYISPLGTRDGLIMGRNNYMIGRRPADQRKYLPGRTLFHRPFSRLHYNRNLKYTWTSRSLTGVPDRGAKMLLKKGQTAPTGRSFMPKGIDAPRTTQIKV